MDSLITIPISKVQLIQRKGRSGRTQPGKCLRIYS
jgi:HrpA-like RNA helicase